MNQSKSTTQKRTSFPIILIIGDLLVLLSFVWIGRSSHSLSMADIGAVLFTALPFIISWFAVTPWFGIYRQGVYQNWRRLVPRLLIAGAIAVLIGVVLRALFLGRPIPGGIMPMFTIITLIYVDIVALIWRLGYMWWTNRGKQSSAEVGVSTEAGGVEL